MKFIDLFAGAGGLSEGFIRAGFEPVAHVEIDKAACFSLRTRTAFHWLVKNDKKGVYVKYLEGEIGRPELYGHVPKEVLDSVICEEISEKTIKGLFTRIDSKVDNVDLIVGGPPCQAYSIAGRSRDKNGMRDDDRNFLYRYYGQFLKNYSPKVFVFENVMGLISAGGGQYLRNMLKYYRSLGYNVEYVKLNARDFGVLQNRKRVLVIGWKKELNYEMPDFKQENWDYNVSEVFRGLGKLQAGQGLEKGGRYVGRRTKYLRESNIKNGIPVLTQHVCRPHTEQDKEIYRIAVEKLESDNGRLRYSDLPEHLITHRNTESHLDRFKVVAAEETASQTIVAHIAKDGHYYIHPDIEQNRSLSVREAARIQSFPDDYYFEGEREGATRTSAFRQIGNAVPPLMAEKIAFQIKTLLSQ